MYCLEDDMKVLFVEDEKELRDSIYPTLSKLYDLDCASNGYEARELILKGSYDVVVTDIHMPRVDGFGNGADLIEFLISQEDHIPIVITTGFHDIADTYAEYACIRVMTKPLDMLELIEQIEAVTKATYQRYNCSVRSCEENTIKAFELANSSVQKILERLSYVDNDS